MLSQNTAEERKRFDQLCSDITENGRQLYAAEMLARTAHRTPDAVALIFNDQSVTYRDLYKKAVGISRQLQHKGLQPGAIVLLFIQNSIDFYAAYFGAWQTGAIVVPLNIYLGEKELQHIIGDAEPAFIIVDDEKEPLIKEWKEHHSEKVVRVSDLASAATDFEVSSFSVTTRQPHDIALLLYTSGTTGLPKGVMLSSSNIMTNLMQGLARLDMQHSERLFAILPLFHSFSQFAFVWGAIFMGCTVIIAHRVDRRSIIDGLEHKPTIILAVPAIFGLFCQLRTLSFDHVKYCIAGGDAIPARIRMGFALLYGRKICSGYGLTETSPLIAVDLEDVLEPTSSVGHVCCDLAYEIRNEQGAALKDGEVGTLWVKGPNVMLGYYKKPQETAEMIQDGWLNTGDLAYIDCKGKIVIAGRIKDLIIHKGFNVYPQEVENIIALHPDVIRVGVIGVPDDQVGETVVAYVQVRKVEEGQNTAMLELCRTHLASYKVPRTIIISTQELVMTATGKVDKKVLRKHETQ